MPNDQVFRVVAVVGAWTAGALLVGWLSGVVVCWAAQRKGNPLLGILHRRCHRPLMLLLVAWALHTSVPTTLDGTGTVQHVLLLALIASTAWLVVRLCYVAEDVAFQRLRGDVGDNNRRVRRARTQIGVLRRLTSALVTLLAFSAMLMTFEPLRSLGASLLASAGIAGAIAGLATQTILRNVAAGLEIALTNRLRLDDVVVVEGEWGRVEEMTLTHVVVRLWDERRLMLPTDYFMTTPFQNWTRNESRVVGSVLLHLRYTAPVRELRAEARRVVESSPLWDRRDWILQVVDSTPWTMVVRVLASADDAPSSWDLRCDIREQLIAFLATHHPDALPHLSIPVSRAPRVAERPGVPPDLVDLSAAEPDRVRGGARGSSEDRPDVEGSQRSGGRIPPSPRRSGGP